MLYKKPLLEILAYDVEDIITESSTTPPDQPPINDPIIQVPSGGNMGSFEDFDSNNSRSTSYYKPF